MRTDEDDGPWIDEPILFLDQFQLPQELLGSGCPTKYQPNQVLSLIFLVFSLHLLVFLIFAVVCCISSLFLSVGVRLNTNHIHNFGGGQFLPWPLRMSKESVNLENSFHKA